MDRSYSSSLLTLFLNILIFIATVSSIVALIFIATASSIVALISLSDSFFLMCRNLLFLYPETVRDC